MTWRIGRFQCSWVPLYSYGTPTVEWMESAHVAALQPKSSKRFATFQMQAGTIVHLFRVTQHRGILWGWLQRG